METTPLGVSKVITYTYTQQKFRESQIYSW